MFPLALTWAALGCLGWAAFAPSSQAEAGWGRAAVEYQNPFRFDFHPGLMHFNKGEVRETKRAYDDGGDDYSGFLSTYTLEDLGLTDDYPTLGLNLEKEWPYFTLRLDTVYANPTAESVAKSHPTDSDILPGQQGYYIGVDEVSYGGRNYEYMWIPEGRKFDADLQTLLLDFKALYTPFHFGPGPVSITPWIGLGIFAVGINYEINAGTADGTVPYGVPPETYVKGGKGTGYGGMALPELVGGAECRIQMGETTRGNVELVLLGNYSFISFNGDPGTVGWNLETTRNIDLSFSRIELEAAFELPITAHTDLILALGGQVISGDVTLESVHRTEEEQEGLSEKYDKYSELEIYQVTGKIGLKF